MNAAGSDSMQLVEVAGPRVLPRFVALYAARLLDNGRNMYFAAGRQCAAMAIAQLGAGIPPQDVPRGAAGEPVWPAGLTGSITHKGDFFAAAVARRSDALSVGLDAELVMDSDRAFAIARIVLLAGERSVGGDSISPALRVSLFFSIKEAVFKCLYPVVLKRFYYEALAITAVNVSEGTFVAELAVTLGDDFPVGRVLSGRFELDDQRVYTGIWLPPDSATDRAAVRLKQ
jgi:enterobactin synthetase component D